MNKIRTGIVNYLNTRPFYYGLTHSPVIEKIELISHYPSVIADWLLQGKIDLGLVPVVVLKQMPSHYIVGNYCIGTEGEIASVALFSDVPLEEIREIYLDYQSRTSVALLKYLMRESWHIQPDVKESGDEDYRKKIQGTTAGLVIGDRAFEQRKISRYVYDLGWEWKKHTGLPFVFAVWASAKPLPEDFISEFDEALDMGIRNIPEVLKQEDFPIYDLSKYFTQHLSYELNIPKKKAMEKFLSFLDFSFS
ncbi:MAG: menaquinone biosynthesis protein [Chitinophagaceae bacterium]|nr:menaquinone biosynthesis protein [Chitinophagaceae bacterium]